MRILYLASASPRRSELLRQLRIPHEVHPVDLDEHRLSGESPERYVDRLARAKAAELWNRLSSDRRPPVLAADTTVALGDEIFGKPSDREDGLNMLRRLSGRTHQVLTGLALYSDRGCDARLSVSEVTFGILEEADCVAYWNTGEPVGKAGGYAVQGLAASFIVHIAGSYSGIMGLPLAETAELLRSRLGWTLHDS